MEECPAGPAVITQMKLQAPLNSHQLEGRAGGQKQGEGAARPYPGVGEKVTDRRQTQERVTTRRPSTSGLSRKLAA